MVRRRVVINVCDLCLELGDEKKATHRYTAADGVTYDICKDCLELVKESGLEHWEI